MSDHDDNRRDVAVARVSVWCRGDMSPGIEDVGRALLQRCATMALDVASNHENIACGLAGGSQTLCYYSRGLTHPTEGVDGPLYTEVDRQAFLNFVQTRFALAKPSDFAGVNPVLRQRCAEMQRCAHAAEDCDIIRASLAEALQRLMGVERAPCFDGLSARDFRRKAAVKDCKEYIALLMMMRKPAGAWLDAKKLYERWEELEKDASDLYITHSEQSVLFALHCARGERAPETVHIATWWDMCEMCELSVALEAILGRLNASGPVVVHSARAYVKVEIATENTPRAEFVSRFNGVVCTDEGACRTLSPLVVKRGCDLFDLRRR